MPKKLLDQARDRLRAMHYSYRTEETYIEWMRRYILFHHKRHPTAMGETEIQAFLTHLASERSVAASTQNQALSAILYLYREVLHKEIQPILLSTAKRPERLPTVLNREDVVNILSQLSGVYQLMAQLLYGSGLRLIPALACRCKCGMRTPSRQGLGFPVQDGHRPGWQRRKRPHHAHARLADCPA